MRDVPNSVRNTALGVGAQAWLADLPHLVSRGEEHWGIRVGAAFGDATEAYVAEAVTAEGSPAVLKPVVPRDTGTVTNEITTLQLCGGDGCVELLRHDAEMAALLLERLGPSMRSLGLPMRRRHELLCDMACRVWRPVPVGSSLPSGADKARSLARWVRESWVELGRPCTQAALDHALACAERRERAHDPHWAVLVHGDLHQWNAPVAHDGFELVDPDGIVAEPPCDLGVLMREDPVELLEADPRDRAEWLATRSGLDVEAIWEWGVVERVSTGLLAHKVGLQPVGAQMLAAADRVAVCG